MNVDGADGCTFAGSLTLRAPHGVTHLQAGESLLTQTADYSRVNWTFPKSVKSPVTFVRRC